MSNITQEYLVLFRAVTEAEQALETLRDRMIEAQQLAEDRPGGTTFRRA